MHAKPSQFDACGRGSIVLWHVAIKRYVLPVFWMTTCLHIMDRHTQKGRMLSHWGRSLMSTIAWFVLVP